MILSIPAIYFLGMGGFSEGAGVGYGSPPTPQSKALDHVGVSSSHDMSALTNLPSHKVDNFDSYLSKLQNICSDKLTADSVDTTSQGLKHEKVLSSL